MAITVKRSKCFGLANSTDILHPTLSAQFRKNRSKQMVAVKVTHIHSKTGLFSLPLSKTLFIFILKITSDKQKVVT